MALVRERATQVRLAVGLFPQLYWIAPHYYRKNLVGYCDFVIPLDSGKWTSEKLAQFVERFVPEVEKRELEKTGETKVEFEFSYREINARFVALISTEGESTHIMVRLLKTL
ncbi:MAG: hypothetical protein QM813_27430 [Verrucomicrobiota bacterium]